MQRDVPGSALKPGRCSRELGCADPGSPTCSTPSKSEQTFGCGTLQQSVFMVCSGRCFIDVSRTCLYETCLYFNSCDAKSADQGTQPRLCHFIVLSVTSILALIFYRLQDSSPPSPFLRNLKCTFKEDCSPTSVPLCLQLTR